MVNEGKSEKNFFQKVACNKIFKFSAQKSENLAEDKIIRHACLQKVCPKSSILGLVESTMRWLWNFSATHSKTSSTCVIGNFR